MKKNIILSTLMLGAGLILASCGGSSSASTKLPESSFEKVQFAFNGVEGKEDNIKANTSVVVFNFTYSTIAGFSFRIVFFNELKA